MRIVIVGAGAVGSYLAERLSTEGQDVVGVERRGELAVERQQLVEENTHLRGELRERYDFSSLIGNSGAMRQVFLQITQVELRGALAGQL